MLVAPFASKPGLPLLPGARRPADARVPGAGQGVANRDVKLENTLLVSTARPLIKLCDFGYSKVPTRPCSVPGAGVLHAWGLCRCSNGCGTAGSARTHPPGRTHAPGREYSSRQTRVVCAPNACWGA